MAEQFSNEEVFKLKQLVCSHENTRDYGTQKSWYIDCSCCGQQDQYCTDCKLVIEHECNDHDTDDGYCDTCR